ncbi:AAA family ATPase [Pseudarthrobacter sp. NPDC057230]|uniref:AAA family ATPase n=1 Tax=Pseudarthrobacter sp. NPDC057230 TaxID=3346057 RepID=UPI0036446511
MRDLPVRRLTVSDFRRIEGTREFPLDAPIVLIHGPNGTGKTSVLSALELALTGSIRSMERSSPRYRAHLPFFGQPYATVRVDVAESLQAGNPGQPLTVGGARTEGTPAFSTSAAQFYAERCYLDQASLSRLLDLYQDREGSNQSALEKFVNELLGLEKLDALRDGLREALDLRVLKKLAIGVDDADREAKAAAAELKKQTALLAECRSEVASARTALRETIAGLNHGGGGAQRETDQALLEYADALRHDTSTRTELEDATRRQQELIALGGRISALIERPTPQRLEETRTALAATATRRKEWEATSGVEIQAWEAAAEAAGANLQTDLRSAIEHAKNVAAQKLRSDLDFHRQTESVRTDLVSGQAELDAVQTRLTEAHEHSSALMESLTAARAVAVESNRCPVCDRDFAETAAHNLLAHIDGKLADLATHGQQLVVLRQDRDNLVARIARAEVELTQLSGTLLTPDQRQSIEGRLTTLTELAVQVGDIELAKSYGKDLERAERDLQQTLDDLEVATLEEVHISREIAKYADVLRAAVPTTPDFPAVLNELRDHAEAHVDRLKGKAEQSKKAVEQAALLVKALERDSLIGRQVVDVVEQKKQWEDRFGEAKRRQGVAKEVHEAASQARTAIVHRVFTESLNDVWKSVFTRLAPDESFIPRFGIPTAAKKTFDIKLETIHRDGETSGPPQMMLSAGNLNTAALSLFLALHLAVEPLVPCLVFDDPVQAMDEVHVAQFAALVRLLSKQNERQVIIAVHERELFDYLALELSPAYEGDELITIELGERAEDEDGGITRHLWAPDIAVVN